jgi:hypothetical protein
MAVIPNLGTLNQTRSTEELTGFGPSLPSPNSHRILDQFKLTVIGLGRLVPRAWRSMHPDRAFAVFALENLEIGDWNPLLAAELTMSFTKA